MKLPFWNFAKNEENEEEIELRIDGDIAMDDDFWSMLFGIENVTPKGFMADLSQYKGKDINVWINSYGGDVYAASRIYTALKEHQGKVKVKVDGVAISAASVIAMAGDEILMSPTSILMIHNPWGNFQGEAKDLRHGADVLDEVKDTIINAYQLKTGKSRAKISQMMDEETWMSAKKAVSEGFVDGMLYTQDKEETDTEPIENSFMFSRFAIQNSVNDKTRDFITQYNKRFKEVHKDEEKIKLLKSKLALECEL
ncbi:head maturation protease, ClpP-related [Clostridium magnum]|uniref:ATP-dependent Clp protease proteolytic subunit n=1 Tax=Clostridium magnum DSM 2767 TaxID=1121326 RepID=A0A162UIX9_9CLOT|nr:head maturation protease, ClpP-related [Clostridium magnum]KZL93965.1 ATP-dependent Clp protease proteolytic subunit 1 [Clostridium magnum DSM 2767]SHH99472.1 ATP-dependent Clp protease, protease subunit [Clostridium magnum DSM 2767]